MRRPMLAQPGGPKDLRRSGFIFEPKLDGTRALLYKGEGIRLINRRDNEITDRYPEFQFKEEIGAKQCVLDGEVVVFDSQGNPSFRLLQKREHVGAGKAHLRSAQHPATFVAFDILELEGKDLTSLPLEERKKSLDQTVHETKAIRKILYTEEGEKLWKLVKDRGIEGVMAKSLSSQYEEGRRSPSWIKIKTTVTIDCAIVGFTSEIRVISSLVLAVYNQGQWVYIGRVGTGFTDEFLTELRKELEKLVVNEPPVSNPEERGITWVRPEMVCEVEFLELTMDRHLRAPVFRRLRFDKAPQDCLLFDLLAL